MDINCVSGCIYQQEGKCALTELPPAAQMTMGRRADDGQGGCAYYVKKERHGQIL